jgi:membrane protease YdiL (CAAX protease family)
MTPEPERGETRDAPQGHFEEIFPGSASGPQDGRAPGNPEEWSRSQEDRSLLGTTGAATNEIHSDYGYPGYFQPSFDRPPQPRLIPNLGHTILFFFLAVLVLAVGQALGILLLQQTHLFGHRSFQALFRLSADDARLSLPVQCLSYLLVAAVVIPVFSLLWKEPFREGVRWNASTARRRWVLLALVGLAAGFGIGALGNFLPMPKDPPIMQDMMQSPVGAWMMLAFGITAAPLLEELAFRGFLLPGLVNSFRWLAHRSVISDTAARWIGIPISVLITSAGFAFMHSPQVSHAWGPLVLIGMVSIVLCVVRLTLNSVAAGVVVHAAYNLTLFAGVLAQTGGFRHLERLTT